jgi:hypothetical protein
MTRLFHTPYLGGRGAHVAEEGRGSGDVEGHMTPPRQVHALALEVQRVRVHPPL